MNCEKEKSKSDLDAIGYELDLDAIDTQIRVLKLILRRHYDYFDEHSRGIIESSIGSMEVFKARYILRFDKSAIKDIFDGKYPNEAQNYKWRNRKDRRI